MVKQDKIVNELLYISRRWIVNWNGSKSFLGIPMEGKHIILFLDKFSANKMEQKVRRDGISTLY